MLAFPVAAMSQQISGNVTDADTGNPLPGASVVVKGTTNGTVTDNDGNFTITANEGDALEVSFVGYGTRTVDAINNVSVALTYSGILLDDIAIVGTRNIARTAVETPTAVDKIDIQSLTTRAATPSINQMLHFEAPSFNSNTQTVSDGTDHIDPASLRGLGPDQVLVLVNGKRRHNTSLVNVNGTFGRGNVGTDMNAIPTMAIKRIDILRDGAAAQYGSDAIAGVISLNLKNSVDKFSAYIGTGAHFSANSNQFSGGVDGESLNSALNYGIKLGKEGFINFTGQYDYRNYYNRARTNSHTIYAIFNVEQRSESEAQALYLERITKEDKEAFGNITDLSTYTGSNKSISRNNKGKINYKKDPVTGKATKEALMVDAKKRHQEILLADVTDYELNKRNKTRKDFNMRVGQARVRNAGLFINMAVPMSDKSKFYSFGGLNYRQGSGAGFYRRPDQTRGLSTVFPDGYLPEIHSTIFDYSMSMGIKGVINKWNFDISNTLGGNSFRYTIKNTANASMKESTKSQFNAGGHSSYQNTFNVDISKFNKDILEGFNIAFGGEFKLDNYKITAGEKASYTTYGLQSKVDVKDASGKVIGTALVNDENGDKNSALDPTGRALPGNSQVFPGFRPENEVNDIRTNVALYTDVELDITDAFLVAGAVRYENYSDFGGTLNGKFATRLKLLEQMSLRGSISTGFRAPSLVQANFNNVSTVFVDGIPTESGTFSNSSRVAKALGIPTLKEETSVNYSIGTTLDLESTGLTLTIDGYMITVNDRILLTGSFAPKLISGNPATPQDAIIQQQLNKVGAEEARFLTNVIDTKTYGIDFVGSYKKDLSKGTLTTSLSATFAKTKTGDDVRTTPILESKKSTFFDEASRLYLEEAIPRIKGFLNIIYENDVFDFSIRESYFGETTEATNTVSAQQVYDARLTTDVGFGVKFLESFKLNLGINNVFDTYPEEVDPNFGHYSGGAFVYTRRSPQFSTGGRFMFARLSVSI